MDNSKKAGASVTLPANDPKRIEELQKFISVALGQLRAEYSAEGDIFRMFSQPVYWGKLLGARPSFLVGGRGTGKTTALRGLTYQGQHALRGADISTWAAVGSYMRIESNVVSSFRGRGLSEDQWERIFAHFLNIQLSLRALAFLQWRSDVLGASSKLDPEDLALFCVSLGIGEELDPALLRKSLRRASAELERQINGPREGLMGMELSSLGQPIGHLTRAMQADEQLRGTYFTFCIDEFENLSPYQQKIVNTLIKHVGDSFYTFKVGARDSSRLERSTLATDQSLSEPADFSTVNIIDELKSRDFEAFAEKICLSRLGSSSWDVLPSMSHLLPSLSTEQEARLLGVERTAGTTRSVLLKEGASTEELAKFDALAPLEQGLVAYWAESQDEKYLRILRDALTNPSKWSTRTQNYSYAMLFALRRGVRGTRKYYCGWALYMQLADGNIRYALQLLHEALMMHALDGNDLSQAVSYEHQTQAASRVGGRIVRELQGISTRGGELTRLTLGLGRIFQVMAAQPHGHTPEVSQFRVSRSELFVDEDALDALLGEAVAQGCLIAFDGDKRASVSGETKSFDYQLHPIFSAYFVFGHRSKRRMTVKGSEVLGLASEHSAGIIRGLLRDRGPHVAQADLPSQLSIYGEFFHES